MSTTRDITIEDQYGGVLHVTKDDNGMFEAVTTPAEGRTRIELDETDRRDLADFLGAR